MARERLTPDQAEQVREIARRIAREEIAAAFDPAKKEADDEPASTQEGGQS